MFDFAKVFCGPLSLIISYVREQVPHSMSKELPSKCCH